MKKTPYLFVFLLFLIYLFFTELVIATYFIVQFIIGLVLIRTITKENNKDVYRMFSTFYVIYGLLTLITQFELISVIDEYHYYVHNDAADAFYPTITDYSIDIPWSSMLESTLFNLLYSNYPLSSLIFSVVGKIGTSLGVENLRLLLRMHEFLFASLIVALITDIPHKLHSITPETNKFIFLFSFCSYLYITSAIFTRDTHVCFSYTLLGYIYLLPKCKRRFLWFILLVVISAGFRPINGVLASLFVFTYYMTEKKMSGIFLMVVLLASVVLYEFIGNILVFGQDSLDYYEGLTSENKGGLFMKVYSLPFPINQIAICIYMLLFPLPLTSYIIGPHESLMNLPFCLSPYIMVLLFLSTIYIAFKGIIQDKKHRYFIYLSIFLYVAIVYGSPDIRRAFAPIPCLFMVFISYLPLIPQKVFRKIQKYLFPPICLISIILTIYTIL